MGFLDIELAAERAVWRIAGSRLVQRAACRRMSVVLLSSRATSPPSRLQSDMTCFQSAPAVQASTTPVKALLPVQLPFMPLLCCDLPTFTMDRLSKPRHYL